MRESPLDFLDYPCDFPLKVVGKSSALFEGIVSELLKGHLEAHHTIDIKKNPSKKNTYVSLTLTFQAQNRQQLENIYQCMHDCPDVIMTL